MEEVTLLRQSNKELKRVRLMMQNHLEVEAESDDESSEEGGLRLVPEIPADEEQDPRPLRHLPLLKAALSLKWTEANDIIHSDRAVLRAKIAGFGQTVLHLAVCRAELTPFAAKLLEMMSDSDIDGLVDDSGDTPLHYAASAGNTEAAKILVRKYPALLQAANVKGLTPIAYAAKYCHKKTVSYLLSECMDSFLGQSGVLLVNFLIQAGFYGIAHDVLNGNPSLALEKDEYKSTILQRLAEKPEAFRSKRQSGPWYRCGYNEKKKHRKAIRLLKLSVSRVTEPTNTSQRCSELLREPLFTATRLGSSKFVVEVIKAYPDSVLFQDEYGRTIFHLAVMHRQEDVYCLLYQMRSFKQVVIALLDKKGNNMLHLAAKLGPPNGISGAAFQMQREVQWFQEVERMVPPSFKHGENKYGKTPREVFTKEHKNLAKEAEEGMKRRAKSYALVSTLVVGVVFAAAFTVPGGNNPQNGSPIFIKSLYFMLFEMANSLALYLSAASLLVSLDILTFRFDETHFRWALPKRLNLALSLLCWSIESMLFAFLYSLSLLLFPGLSWMLAVPASLLLITIFFLRRLRNPAFHEELRSANRQFGQKSDEIIA